jgi:lipoprotein NlpD
MMWRNIILLSAGLSLTGCGVFKPQEAAPVVDISHYKPVTKGTHTVQRGESLYEIAWRYGRDYRDIALANHISPPYVIHPGQQLSLKETPRTSIPLSSEHHPRSVAAKQAAISYENTKISKSGTAKAVKSALTASHWSWPVEGKIIKHYASGTGIKGIDIAGHTGKQVKTAAPGKVVYSGSGLRGYGLLVIIKHDDTYLSAYGHNSRLLVKEGDPVKKGQAIAEMGQTDADSVKLHFEIRKNGQPINPLNVLPPL